ncbi:hypothetical protein [Myceligenerans pegani]|uniref:Integral membrane protein n=1 Tax=Myceligenerans pegani TaxID=2776917 RepID=A0ABR9N681_9MICO|nr:hypothetical protein [Myceligenerans sp. TRM 65318]MBE1878664.1 hypothetical protein [Myceligenerans sp. TRM 65318]MBE3020935.1 hypothetical protein [Myceligenerans sp. TRM 65318]
MRILLTAGRLLIAHWPALLALGFAGVALRGAAFWGALEVSEWNALVAQIVLLALPLGLLLPVIAMLRVCYPSLGNLTRPRPAGAPPGVLGAPSGGRTFRPGAPVAPHAPGNPSSYAADVPERREQPLADVALAVLIPFLAVYAIEGTMDADHAQYLNDVAADELFGTDMFTPGGIDFASRLGLWTGWTLVGVVLGAIVLRWLLGLLDRKVHFLGLTLLGAAVEVFWSVQAAYDLESLGRGLLVALQDRALVHWSVGTYTAATETAQGAAVAEAGAAAVDGLITVVESLDVVIVAPLAWLAIGTVVLGRRLMAPPSTEHRWLDQMTMPGWLRKVLEAVTQELRERFSALVQGLRMIKRGGIGAMLVFCLAYLVVMRAPVAVGWAVRAITGPVETDLWLLVISPWEEAAGIAISLALAGALIAATVDTMVGRGMTVAGEPEKDGGEEGAIPGTFVAS